jgi:hypothetical protein
MAEKLITLDNIKYIIKQMQAHFQSPFARRLKPGAKINGILFDGGNDISVPTLPTKNIELTAECSVSIMFSDSSNARMVMANNGLYFWDGSALTNIIKVTQNTDGTYSISSNLSATTSSTATKNTIGFVTT